MIFKTEKVENEFKTSIPRFLMDMCIEFSELSKTNWDIESVVTRVLEQIPGDSGIHEHHLAVDFRDEYVPGKFLYGSPARVWICQYFNEKYPRNDGKPTLLWHSFQGNPHHFHFQLSPNMLVYVPSGRTQ